MKDASFTFFTVKKDTNEAIVAPCSSGIQSKNQQCFTNSACYGNNVIADATGQLQWKNLSKLPYQQTVSGQRWGSAFFITPNLIITAGHCFDVCKGNGDWLTPFYGERFLTPYEFAPLIQLNMDYAYNSCNPTAGDQPESHERSFNITKLVEWRIGGLDYAIAEVQNTQGSNYSYLSFDFSFKEGKIFIVQHPQGAPKKLEIGYGVSNGSNDQQVIEHNANTLGGSSGSSLSTFFYKVCGVHVKGREGDINTAVHINAILQRSPIIKALYYQQNPYIDKEPNINNFNWLLTLGLFAAGSGTVYCLAKNQTIKKTALTICIASIIGLVVKFLCDSSLKKINNKPDNESMLLGSAPMARFH